MSSAAVGPAVIPVSSLKSYFIDSLQQAVEHEQVHTDESVLLYLGELLVAYARAEHLYDHTEDGLMRRPLVDLYRMSLESDSTHERKLCLQRLGDIALFVSGILPESLERSLVDVDYYISMGSNAYACLSDLDERDPRGRARAGIFQTLSGNFSHFVDLLNHIVAQAPNGLGHDIMRLYDTWARTGSRRLHRRLLALGVTPLAAGTAH